MQVCRQPAADAAFALSECYIRGNDVVANYAAVSPRTVPPVIYWRAIHFPHGVAGIDLLISMQTSRLNSDPRITNRSIVPACEVWCLMSGQQPQAFRQIALSACEPWTAAGRNVAGAFLFRLTGHDVSYLEIISPAELAEVELCREGELAGPVRLSYQLFPERLEKGVIRRVPIRSLLLPRGTDQQLALDHHRQQSVASPPLAT